MIQISDGTPELQTRTSVQRAAIQLTQTGQRMGPQQGVTIDEGLSMFTRSGAFASSEEDSKGTITPGKLADLIVLSGDPRAIPAEDLLSLSVEMTIIDGRVAYKP
jgi:predicted amidohydrolase YtcJ